MSTASSIDESFDSISTNNDAIDAIDDDDDIVVCLNIVNKDFAALCKTNRHLFSQNFNSV